MKSRFLNRDLLLITIIILISIHMNARFSLAAARQDHSDLSPSLQPFPKSSFAAPLKEDFYRQNLSGISGNEKLQGEILTLALAKKIALEKSPTLAAARERVYQASEAVVQARADYLPTISATSAWSYTEKTDDSAAGYNENSYTNRISATQLLFDGFLRKYSTMSATYGEKMNLASQHEAQRLLAWSVAQSFLNVQLSLENIKIAESDMAFNQEQEKEAVAKERSGVGSFSDVLNFKTGVNKAQASIINARQNLKESIYGLAALLGYESAQLPLDMKIAPLDTHSMDADLSVYKDGQLYIDMEDLVARRPDLKKAWLAVKKADSGVKMASSGYYPTVSLTGSYGTTSGDKLNDMADIDKMGGSVGVTVNFELFAGGITKSRVSESKSLKRELEKELDSSKITAVAEIRSAADNIISARQQLSLQKENADLVKKMRDLVEKEYSAGQTSLVRLNEAQNNLVSTLGELAIARVSLILATEQFYYYTGDNID